jgi:kynurenine formamidase
MTTGVEYMTGIQFPYRYGQEDTLGALNEITPTKVIEAAALIRQGRRYQLGQVLEESSPTQMSRYWKHSLGLDRVIPGRYLGENQQSFVEETVAGALHSGTHLDGLGHVGVGPYAYNGNLYADIVTSQGLTKLGIEGVAPIFTRGVLLDVARAKGVTMLEDTYVITDADLAAAVDAQGVEIRAGDAVLIHTGWGALWMVDNARYKETEPGIGLAAARWCTDRRVCLIGADNWAVESVPADPPELLFPVHQQCIALYGCYLLENVATHELARDRVYEFCFVVLPARFKGGSASPVAPLAVV